METLCNEMASAQQLSVPRETLDGFPLAYLNQLASEGVLTFDERRYGFGHESFFDYCFARLFVNRAASLVSFLKGSEQHLFRRAQVRQVLAYLRDADRAGMHRSFAPCSGRGIRAHIKDLAFAPPRRSHGADRGGMGDPGAVDRASAQGHRGRHANPDKLSEIAWGRFFGELLSNLVYGGCSCGGSSNPC